MDWFTVEAIDKHSWVISEYKHWEETHCYLLEGQDSALLIDSGLGICDLSSVIRDLTNKPVTVIATHIHWDHIGNHGSFDRMGVHPLEAAWLECFPVPLPQIRRDLCKEPCDFPKDFNPAAYMPFRGKPDFMVSDGHVIDLGGRRITALHTPGHSPGHLCFYEADSGYLFTGDLLYAGTLYAFYPSTDPAAFAASLERICPLPISRLFPGHHCMEIELDLLHQAHGAFCKLKDENRLFQGSGIYDFGNFQIHI